MNQEKNGTDIVYDFLKLPHKCPAGAYCPAGTARQYINDTINNAPQSCIEGYYCPDGSIKPTQKACPYHATSPHRSKSWIDCYCEDGYFGIAINDYYCIKCYPNGICNHKNESNLISHMKIPEGYWPNYPENITNILMCQNSTQFKTPCLESKCELQCKNFTFSLNTTVPLDCVVKCENNCIIGHEDRLCSKCKYGYFLKNTGHCSKCSFGKSDSFYLILPIVAFLSISILFILRKIKRNKNSKLFKFLNK